MEGMERQDMKVVILAGGMGTRIGEETQFKPKPMVEIGDKPILWHIMKWYASFGFCEFVICCGYKGHMIKEYFTHYYTYQTDSKHDLSNGTIIAQDIATESWKVTLVDTGLKTLTAGRILKAKDYLEGTPFLLTYGDGVSDVNIYKLIDFHQKSGRISTITTTRPEGRFGAIKIENGTGRVESFKEKARKDQAWVNAGFMVMQPEIFEYLGDGSEMLEASPFEKLVRDGQMGSYQHDGFWSPMDTMRDKAYLEKLWKSGEAPWKA